MAYMALKSTQSEDQATHFHLNCQINPPELL